MPEIRISSISSSISPSSISQGVAYLKSQLPTFKGFEEKIPRWAKRQVIFWRWNVNYFAPSIKNSSNALNTISKLAENEFNQMTDAQQDLNIEDDHREYLNKWIAKTASQTSKLGQVGPEADLPIRDPEITRAINSETSLTEAWEKTEKKNCDILCHKLSVFGALKLMNKLTEKENINLFHLVGIATKEGETRTLWQIFSEHHKDLTWFQEIQAKVVYWLGFRTSLISSTVEAYVKEMIHEITDKIVSDNDQVRFSTFNETLEEINAFLVEDYKATQAFAKSIEIGTGDLKDFRNRAIEKDYGGLLKKLCQKIGEKIEKKNIDVALFSNLQKIFILGHLFKAIEWFTNRFIIQKIMKNWILPTVIESAVEATKTHEIEIKLALTSFLTLKIENFIFELEQKKRSSAKPSLMFSENKILTTLVKNLKIVIDLEQCTTQPELRNKIAEIDAPKKRNLLDEKIETEILNGIKHGFHLLCDYLNKTAKSHELTARLLALSCIPFSIKNENPNESINLFNDAIEKLEKDKVENLANAIIESARSKYESTIPENEKNIAEQIFKEARIIIKTTFFRLQEICKQMIDKINHSAQAPLDPENNVQQEITKFLTILKIFANREEFHKKMKELDPSDQGRIWHELDPVFDRAIKLEKSILALQETESNHHKHAKVVNQLKSVKIFFETLIHTFPKQPRHMRNSVKPTLEKFCEEMTRYLGRPKAPIVIKLKEPIPLLSKLSEKIANEQQVLDALNDLFSLPEDSQPMTKLGLLNQLFNYKFSEPPQGFKLKTNLADIDKCVDSFPDKEKKELRALIGDGSNLLETCGPWDSLFEMIHRIRQDHSQTKQEDLDEWNKTLREMVDWVEKKGEGYMFLKIEDHKKMEDTIKTVSSEIEEFRNKGLPMQLNPPLHLTQNHIKMGLAATAVATGAFGLVGWATALTAAAASAKADVIIPAVIQAKVLPKVKEFFKNASTLCFSPRIYKAGTTRILKAIAK